MSKPLSTRWLDSSMRRICSKRVDDMIGGGQEDARARSHPPEELLRSIVGCWQLGDREEWTISRTEQGGALVTRRLLTAQANPGYARRAATPSEILYDAKKGTLRFFTAGPHHALLFVFSADPAGLTGNWASSHAPGEGYQLTGGSVTLRPCSDAGDPCMGGPYD